MKRLEVSVIIPVYNSAVSLGRAIDSVLGQSHQPLEIIVINDGSTDNSAEVTAGYGDKIIYIEQDNQGQAAARNAGLRISHGKYIAMLDADDYWLPGFLDKCVNFLEKNPKAIAVSTGQIIKRWGHKEIIKPAIIAGPDKPQEPFIIDDFFRFWAEHNHITTGSNVIRRDIIEKAGYQLPDLRTSQDLEYWGYLATFGKWGMVPEALFVSDGTAAAAHAGWRNRYKTRRAKCPNLEQWQRRIAPRLREEDRPSFDIVRARVAKNFAHSMILGSNHSGALSITLKYGKNFPSDLISKVMVVGANLGIVGWRGCCYLLCFREYLKGILVAITPRN